MKKFLKIFLSVIGAITALLGIAALVLLLISPGKTSPLTDADGKVLPAGIAEINSYTLGGYEQSVIIRGADTTLPVMLFLHGGPGSPEIAIMKKMNPGLEKDFVVAYWEQRGAGKSFSADIPDDSMTIEQMVSDAAELSRILTDRFGCEKLYIAGHSWGSLLGIKTAYLYPELFHAYIGIGQVCKQYEGEKVSYEWVKEQAEKENDKKAMAELGELVFPDSTADSDAWLNFLMKERSYVNKYGGGITHEIRNMWPAVKMVMGAEEYSFREKMNYPRGNNYSMLRLWEDVIDVNLFNEIDSMQVPVYIFQGRYDYQTPHVVAREFYDQLKAPAKGFYTFENSAHSPLYEEPEKFNRILREI